MCEERKAIEPNKQSKRTNYGGFEINKNIVCFVSARFCNVWTMRFGVFEHTSHEMIVCVVTHFKQIMISLDVCSRTPEPS